LSLFIISFLIGVGGLIFFFQFSLKSHDNTPSPAVIAVLAEPQTLPCAQIETSIRDGNGDRYAKQARFYVSWHIVASFRVVSITCALHRKTQRVSEVLFYRNRSVTLLQESVDSGRLPCQVERLDPHFHL
jgi:hypothetical protein